MTSIRTMATHGPIISRVRLQSDWLVLSIGRLGVASGAEYYLDTVANSVDDYYLGRGEAPGQWIGSSAIALGLTGTVDPTVLRNLLDGRSADGEDLGIMRRAERRPGFDVTFSTPKGLSLLWAFGSPEVAGAVSEAHDRAVTGVIDHLSHQAAYVRRGVNGTQLERASGFVAAGFRHRTSRAGDPQLHTHVLIPNVVFGIDGRWSAPDARQLYHWQKTATALYHSALRAELAPLGLTWKVGRNSLGELSGIDPDILRAFSKRRVDIEASLDKLGLTSQRAAEVAALATRGAKPRHIGTTDSLRHGWESELGAVRIADGKNGTRGATTADVMGAVMASAAQPVPGTGVSGIELEEILATLAGERSVDLADYDLSDPIGPRLTPLTLFTSTFTYREALAAVARAFDATPSDVADLTDQLVARNGVMRMVDPHGRQPDLSGKGVDRAAWTVGDRRFTTKEMLIVEGRIVNSAVRRVGCRTAQVDQHTTDEVLAANRHLDGEQAAGVRHLLSSGNGLDVVIGQAGTGKSTMLGAARAGWEQARYQVIGAAIASRTAADLQAGTGIESVTMAQLIIDLERSQAHLTSRHVVVVDEASLVGSRTLGRLQHHVDQAQAKLVLVGDNRQLSSIDAGGALRALSASLGDHVVTLTTNRRQADIDQGWERQALVDLRNGEVARAIAAYDAHDRIAVANQVADARHALIDQWWTARRESTTAILAVTRVDVIALNDMARERLRAEGELGAEIRLASGKSFAIGDRLLLKKNARAQLAEPGKGGRVSTTAIRNGTFATVVAITGHETRSPSAREGDVTLGQGDVHIGHDQGPTGQDPSPTERADRQRPSLIVELDSGKRVLLKTEYLEKSTNLGYALTVFRSQGITVDHSFLLANDALFQEAGYTALSRGRISNNVFTVAPELPRSEVAHADEITPRRDALSGLVDALSHSHEQTMALESLPTATAMDGERSGSVDSDRPHHLSVEEWFQFLGQSYARLEDLDSEPPAAVREAPPPFSWDRDRGYDRAYDGGFGL